MKKDQIFSEILEIIKIGELVNNSEINNLNFNTTLLNLGLDSLDLLGAIVEIEEKFNIDIPDEEVSSYKTLGDITHGVFVQSLLKRERV